MITATGRRSKCHSDNSIAMQASCCTPTDFTAMLDFALCDLVLGQVVRDAHAAVFLGTEALRQLQQQLTDAAGHVGEDVVGQIEVSTA
jgi:hypothetical protein